MVPGLPSITKSRTSHHLGAGDGAVRSKLATYREDAREIEVENVAIVN
jgi:hypothetical protein